jgi:hypothetical protein
VIVFDLRCGGGHVFEAWFASGAAYEEQRAGGHVTCPVCGDAEIAKAAMAPAVSGTGERGEAPDPKAMLRALAAIQAKSLERSTWVGKGFATRARAMHAGEEAERPIHGQATLAEAKQLADEGVPVAPLPLPVVPPDTVN